jgi:hypothetical protein
LENSDENKNNEANESVHKEVPVNRLLYKENIRLLIGQLPALFDKKIRTSRDYSRRALPS